MASIDYARMTEKVRDTLSAPIEIEKKPRFSLGSALSTDKVYEMRLGALFVDMRASKELYSGSARVQTAKVLKTFDGCVLRALKSDDCVEIGIRGGCIFAIYSIGDEFAVTELYERAAEVNSVVELLNRLYEERNMGCIKVGIGAAYSRGLAARVKYKPLGERCNIWIGEAISDAERFAKIGNSATEEGTYGPIVISPSINTIVKETGYSDRVTVVSEFKDGGGFFHGNALTKDYEFWKKDNMGS